MNEERIIDAIGNIDEALILETQKLRSRKAFPYKKVALVAACILLTVALLPIGVMLSKKDPSVTDPSRTDILQNNDTTSSDTEKEPDVTTSDVPDSTHDNSQRETQSPDIPKEEDTTDVSSSPQILPPLSSTTQAADTQKPHYERPDVPEKDEPVTTDKETTGPYTEDTKRPEKTDPTLPTVPNLPTTPTPGPVLPTRPGVLSRAIYPVQKQYYSTPLTQWRNEKDERINSYKNGIGNTESFMYRTVYEFFSKSGNENTIYSPVNVYMALGMLTETTAGNSRAQLLNLLGKTDIYSLRSSAKSMWNCCYRDDGIVTCILGNSLWIDDLFIPNTAVTDVLASDYYASSFYGNMGDKEFDELMHSWINEQTKDILKDTVSNSTFHPYTKMSLISTLYFKAEWYEDFSITYTNSSVFHSPDGDITTEYMKGDAPGLLYEGTNFRAASRAFKEGGNMWFILPNEKISLQSLFNDNEAMGFITGKAQKNLSYKEHSARIDLQLPKFDLTTQLNVAEGLKNLGVTDIFDPLKADFSTLTDIKELYVYDGDVIQNARVRVEEKGCEAGASIKIPIGMGSAQRISFNLTRPFIFVITSDTGIPLFIGTVNNPNQTH